MLHGGIVGVGPTAPASLLHVAGGNIVIDNDQNLAALAIRNTGHRKKSGLIGATGPLPRLSGGTRNGGRQMADAQSLRFIRRRTKVEINPGILLFL